MRILTIRVPEGVGANARFDLEVNEHLRLFGLHLKLSPDGQHRVFSGRVCGKHAASFHPVLARQITDAAVDALAAQVAG